MAIVRIGGAVFAGLILATAARAQETFRIALQPLAPVKSSAIESVRKSVAARFSVVVDVLPTKPLPKSAYYTPRNRYRAEKLLTYLDANTSANYSKVIGITSRDISTTKGDVYDWGIFGLGAIGMRPCVLSTFRLGRGVTAAKAQERLNRVALHEAGHTFGLDHCPTPRCTMNDARGSITTVDAETGFCAACVRFLGANLRR